MEEIPDADLQLPAVGSVQCACEGVGREVLFRFAVVHRNWGTLLSLTPSY